MIVSLIVGGLLTFLVVPILSQSMQDQYLYQILQPEEREPVMEYVLPEGADSEKDVPAPPPFISTPYDKHRVVEFYAPWCPHCKHFKPHYIQFARDMTALVQRANKQQQEKQQPAYADIEFWAVSCTVHHQLCQNQGIYGYPTVKMFAAGQVNGTMTPYWKLHPFHVLRAFGMEIQDEGIEGKGGEKQHIATPNNNNNMLRTNDQETKKKEPIRDLRTLQEIYHEAYLSFHFAMQTGIFMTMGPLSNSTKDAFEVWIDLLDRSLPPTWKIHQSLTILNENIETAVQSEQNLLNLLQDTKPEERGESRYTQGLWQLFHIMTLGVVEWNKHAVNEYAVISSEEAANALHDYIANFFACDVCRQNFLKGYDACEAERCTRLGTDIDNEDQWKQLPLWLWEVHNGVNVRLLREAREKDGAPPPTREEQEDVEWPSRHDCPLCWREDGSYNDKYVYQHLRLTYWPNDDVNKELRPQFQRAMNEYVKRQVQNQQEKLEIDDHIYGDGGQATSLLNLPKTILVPGLLSLGGLLAILSVAYSKKMAKDKSGRHKKRDS